MSAEPGPVAPAEAPPAPAGGAAAPAVDAEGRFFLWLRSLGIVRDGGWLGGVCAAIAERTGVDPVIVRGILVVVTVLGFPGLWLYAIAWALLPDRAGRIPLQMRAGSAPALVGVAVAIGAAVLVLWAGNSVLEAMALVSYPGRWLWSFVEAGLWLAGLGALAAILILFLRRRSARHAIPPQGGDGGVSGTAAVFGGAALSVGSENSAAPPTPSPEPPEPIASELATTEELDAWRVQHAAWREQHDAWRRAQADGSAVAEERARRAAERAAFRAEAARMRAERRAAKPRTSVAFVVIAVGAALVAATATWLAFQPNAAERSWPAAVFAAAAVTAVAMVVAGILRRRSGFLTAVTIVLLVFVSTGSTSYLLRDLTGPDRYVPLNAPQESIAQPFGGLTLDVGGPYDDPGITRIEKGTGALTVLVYPGVDVELETTGDAGTVHVTYYSDQAGYLRDLDVRPSGGRFTWSRDDEETSRKRTIVLDQDVVEVYIEVQGVER